MARIKNSPEAIKAKNALAKRLRQLREEGYGERGGPELARKLGIPVRTWYNYESGVTVPAEVVLKIVELTGVDPLWLLNGDGERSHAQDEISFTRNGSSSSSSSYSGTSTEALLREALKQLETRGFSADPAVRNTTAAKGKRGSSDESYAGAPVEPIGDPSNTTVVPDPNWLPPHASRGIRVFGDDMAPVLHDGAFAVFLDVAETPEELDGKLVIAWIDKKPIVRWYHMAGSHAALVAQNPLATPSSIVIPVSATENDVMLRRVLWVTTPR